MSKIVRPHSVTRRQFLLGFSLVASSAIAVACGQEPKGSAVSALPTPAAPTRIVAVPTPLPAPSPMDPISLGQVQLVATIAMGSYKPIGVTVDERMNLFVIDMTPRVSKFDSSGRMVTAWGGSGSNDGEFFLTDAGFLGSNIASDQQGNVYIPDTGNARIEKFDGSGRFLLAWGSRGTGKGQFMYPHGVAVDRQRDIVYVADTNNGRIQVFDTAGHFLALWGGGISQPIDIAVGSGGNLLIVDLGQVRILRFDSTGRPLAQWGGYGTRDGQFAQPLSCAVDGQGNLYVADTGNHRIQQFDSNGQFIAQWGNRGSDEGQFLYPTGVAVDGQGAVFIADSGNHRVLKFHSMGG